MTIKALVPQSNNRFHICGMQLVASILQIDRMALLGLVVDLADLTCHIDVIGGRPLLVGFDSGLQLF